MTVTQKEMLDHAMDLDRKVGQQSVKIGKAILSVPPEKVAEIPHPSELQLTEDDVDPFGGNINNRNVAKRIAAQKSRVFTNPHRVIHTGDPDKARRDIAKSEELNPDSLSPQEMENAQQADELRDAGKLKPTPGSPAADRAKAQANAADSIPERQTPSPSEAAAQSFAAGAHAVPPAPPAPAAVPPVPWKPGK